MKTNKDSHLSLLDHAPPRTPKPRQTYKDPEVRILTENTIKAMLKLNHNVNKDLSIDKYEECALRYEAKKEVKEAAATVAR